MKKVSIIKYNLKGVPVTRKTLIHRALYGYTDHSNKSTYTYKRKGALDRIEHTKISNSVLLVDAKDVKQLMSLFNKYKIRVDMINLIMP